MIGIQDMAIYVPRNKLSLGKCHNRLGINKQLATIYQRIYKLNYIAIATHATIVDFLSQPINQLLSRHALIKNQIKLIVYAHTSAITCGFGCSIVRQIQQRFAFRNALAISTTLNKCVSSIKALEIASKFLLANQDAHVLILTGEICYAASIRHIPNMSVAGDAAVAILISSSSNQHRLLNSETFVDGRYAKGIWMPSSDLKTYNRNFLCKIKTIFKTILVNNKLLLKDIEIIFPHNINLLTWQQIARAIGIPKNKIYLNNISKIGHTLGADIYINFYDALHNGRLVPGMKSLMFSVGLGASYGYALWLHNKSKKI